MDTVTYPTPLPRTVRPEPEPARPSARRPRAEVTPGLRAARWAVFTAVTLAHAALLGRLWLAPPPPPAPEEPPAVTVSLLPPPAPVPPKAVVETAKPPPAPERPKPEAPVPPAKPKPVAVKPVKPKPPVAPRPVVPQPVAVRDEPTPQARAEPAPAAVEPGPAAVEPWPAAVEPAVEEPVEPPPLAPEVIPARFDADYLNNPKPDYPRLSRRAGEEGTVLLRVRVTETGRPQKIELQESSGSSRLDRAAIEAVREWTFVPARQAGQPVASWVLVPIPFVLEG